MFTANPATTVRTQESQEFQSSVRPMTNFRAAIEFDLGLRFTDESPRAAIDGYFTLDLRPGWSPTPTG